MKTLLCIAACLFSVTCFGQTKLISFRSHSGSDANFRTAVESDMFNTGSSNWGLSSVDVSNVDSVILKGPNRIIVLRKTYTILVGIRSKPQNVVFIKDVLTKDNAANFFAATSMDSLKVQIKRMYKTAKLDSTRFIGFDKKFK